MSPRRPRGEARAHFKRAQKLQRSGLLSEAAAAYRTADEADHQNPLIALHYCTCLLGAGRADDAVEQARLAVAGAPSMAAPRIFLSLGLLRSGDLDGAEAEARLATELDPSNTSAWAQLGLVLVTAGRWGEGYDILRDQLPSSSTPVAAGVLAWCEGELAKLPDAPPAEEIHPSIWGAPPARTRGGRHLLLSRLELSALSVAYTFVYAGCPRARRAYLGLIDGDALTLAGVYERAVEAYRRSLASAADQYRSRLGLGLALLLSGNPRECRRELCQLPPQLQSEHQAALLLGACEVVLGRPEVALPHLQRASEAKPAEFPALYYLGRALMETGDAPGALSAFGSALSTLHPNVPAKRLDQLARLRERRA